MKKITLFLLITFICFFSFSQVDINSFFEKSPELIIKFEIQNRTQLDTLTRMLSIDNVKGKEVVAYTTKEEFEQFLTLNIPYEIIEKPVLTLEELNMLEFEDIKNSRTDWNFYPSYEVYISLMEDFATTYPGLCRLVEFGTSVQNRKLLACVLSKNVNVREAEPQVLFSSTMHGDECTGYVLMLHYIDYLLSNYGIDDRITYLLDNMEIWINPLANPDGTYFTGNSNVNGAIRYNANYVDLNRNYKDWVKGDHPDGKAWQKETLLFMDLQDEENFVLGVNIHGGDEVCNYPWDNSYTLTADEAWWQFVCREYADTVHVYNSNYMNGFNNGIVRGCNWYVIDGGRQDYCNYYRHHREFTLEISTSKTPTASNLPNYWNWNYRSFLNYTQQALYGIHGKVTDAYSGEPLDAKIFISGHDVNESYVMTDSRVGYYVRPIKGGTYSVTYSATGYQSQTVSITVSDKQKTVQNIFLIPDGVNLPVADFTADIREILPNETVKFTDLSAYAMEREWYFEGGTPETSTEQNPTVLYKTPGNFDVKLTASNPYGNDELLMEDYITVKQSATPPIANFEADKIEIFQNEKVNFKDLSENVTTWNWFFEGGEPETSNEQNPSVLYKNPGNFDVKLTVTNDQGADEMLKENYIKVHTDTLSINEMDELSIQIYPNPTTGELKIENGEWRMENGEWKIENIEIFDIYGRNLTPLISYLSPHTSYLSPHTSYLSPLTSIDISHFPAGLYFVKISTETEVIVKKIIKN